MLGVGAPSLPRVAGGRYTVLGSVGRGAIAEVLRARDETSGAVVALKLLYPHLRESAVVVERFRREVDIVRRIAHPHVLAIREVVESDDLLFLVMDYHPGGDLADRLAARGPLDADGLRTLAAQLCGALAAAHRAGVVHRDVKPSNVLCGPGAALDVRLCDFGLARTGELSGLTTANAVLGTPEYMAPEIITDGHADPRSDIYSLGVVLLEAATGRLPFYGDSPYQLMRQHIDVEAPRASTLAPGLPRAIDEAIARALAKDPLDRFATAEDFARALVTGTHAPARELVPSPASRRLCPTCGGWLVEAAAACADCGAKTLRLEPAARGADVLVVGPGEIGDKLDARKHVALYALLGELPPGSVVLPRKRKAPRVPFFVARSIAPASAKALVARLEGIGLQATTESKSVENSRRLRRKVFRTSGRYLVGFTFLIQTMQFWPGSARLRLAVLSGIFAVVLGELVMNVPRTYRPLVRLIRGAVRASHAEAGIADALPFLSRRPDRRLLGHILGRVAQLDGLPARASITPLVTRAAHLAAALVKLEESRAHDASISPDGPSALVALRREERLGVMLRAELLRIGGRLDDLSFALATADARAADAEVQRLQDELGELALEADAEAEVAALLAKPS